MFLGREIRSTRLLGRVLRNLDRAAMQKFARDKLNELGLMTIQNINQPVETLSGGQRQGVAVARAAAFAKRVVIMDEPTAALGVKESRRVLELILDVKKRGLPIILISHNMPHVFEVADRVHIHRLGRRLLRHRSQKAVDVRRGRDDDRCVGAADRTSGVRAERRSRAHHFRHAQALPCLTQHHIRAGAASDPAQCRAGRMLAGLSQASGSPLFQRR